MMKKNKAVQGSNAAAHRAAITGKVTDMVSKLALGDIQFLQWNDFDELVKFLTTNTPWSNELDGTQALLWVYGITWRVFSSTVPFELRRKQGYNLLDEHKTKITKAISDEVLDFPKTYEVFIPLPHSLPLEGHKISIAKGMSLVTYDGTTQPTRAAPDLPHLMGRLAAPSLEDGRTYVRVTATGHYTTAAEIAISRTKRLVMLSDLYQSGLLVDYSDFGRTSHEANVEAVAHEAHKAEAPLLPIRVPPELIRALETRRLTGRPSGGLLGLAMGTTTSPIADLQAKAVLIDEWGGGDEVERVRTALEWASDSAHSGNDTRAFIEGCIAIEALIGDTSADRGLTDRLVDRCSYALGKDARDRSAIAADFREIYKLRSELVHGRTASLSAGKRKVLRRAQELLNSLLLHEIRMLGINSPSPEPVRI